MHGQEAENEERTARKFFEAKHDAADSTATGGNRCTNTALKNDRRQPLIRLKGRYESSRRVEAPIVVMLRVTQSRKPGLAFPAIHTPRRTRPQREKAERGTALGIWNLNFGVAARLCTLDGIHYSLYVQAEHRPLRVTQDDDRDPASRQVLLIADILVRGEEHLKRGLFCGLQECAVAQRIPPEILGFSDRVIS